MRAFTELPRHYKAVAGGLVVELTRQLLWIMPIPMTLGENWEDQGAQRYPRQPCFEGRFPPPGPPAEKATSSTSPSQAMKRWVLWAVLKNSQRTVDVPSYDWEHTMKCLHVVFCRDQSQQAEQDDTWSVNMDEASRLAAAIEAGRDYLCPGRCMVNASCTNQVCGTQMIAANDGLSMKERARRLVEFLREGGFTWRFESRELAPNAA